MSKHTPGPWIVYEFVDGYDIRSPEAECWVAMSSDPEAVWGAIGREEDARLIAAAPELLEALEFFVAAGGKGRTFYAVEGELLQDCVDKARAAIAKAKGEEG